MSQTDASGNIPRHRALVATSVPTSQIVRPSVPRTNAQQRPADLSPYLSKLALIAIPRAGISLLGPIAQRYGWIGHYLPDTTAAPTGRARIDVTRMAEMLPPGTFLAGPIRHDEATTASLTTFRKILLVRDLRSILVSRLALERRLKRHASLAPVWQQKDLVGQMSLFLSKFGPVLFDEILSILPWLTEPGIIAWRFEEMLTPGDQLARMIATTLRRDFNPPRDVLRLDIMSRRSANRRHFADYWSNEAEKTFTAFGGPQMNRLLGYERES